MSPSRPEPIKPNWPAPAVRTACAAELAAVIGTHEIEALEPHAAALAAAVLELAHDARGRPLVGVGDPLVTQVRALGRLAIRHPSSISSAAAQLLDALDDQQAPIDRPHPGVRSDGEIRTRRPSGSVAAIVVPPSTRST